MKLLLITLVLVRFSLTISAQSEHKSFFYKIREYYYQSIPNEPDYYKDVPIIDSIELNGKILSDSLFNMNRYELVNILLKPIPKVAVFEINSLDKFKKDSINEVVRRQKENISGLISEKESAADNLIRNVNDIIHLREFSKQLGGILFKEVYTDSILTNPDFITILSFLELNEVQKRIIIEDNRTSLFCKAHLGDEESINKMTNQFWGSINEEFNSNISDLIKLASSIILINNEKLNQEFLEALQSEKTIYSKPGDQGNLKAYSLSYLMITAYNKVYYNKLTYFMRYVRNNPNIIEAMQPYYYYKAISLYFKDAYNREISIRSRKFLYDTNIKYLNR